MAAMPMMASIPEDSSYRFTYNPVLIEVDKDSAESFFLSLKVTKNYVSKFLLTGIGLGTKSQ